MHPYLPFAAIPLAVTAAWFAASHWSGSEPGRYRVPSVARIENPSVPVDVRSQTMGTTDIRVASLMPHTRPKPPAPDPELILYSVMTGNDVHLATINAQVVKEGDRVEGYVVKRISADGVELGNGSKTRRLPMRPLHELPPPTPPGMDPVEHDTEIQHDQAGLAQNERATFDPPQL